VRRSHFVQSHRLDRARWVSLRRLIAIRIRNGLQYCVFSRPRVVTNSRFVADTAYANLIGPDMPMRAVLQLRYITGGIQCHLAENSFVGRQNACNGPNLSPTLMSKPACTAWRQNSRCWRPRRPGGHPDMGRPSLPGSPGASLRLSVGRSLAQGRRGNTGSFRAGIWLSPALGGRS